MSDKRVEEIVRTKNFLEMQLRRGKIEHWGICVEKKKGYPQRIECIVPTKRKSYEDDVNEGNVSPVHPVSSCAAGIFPRSHSFPSSAHRLR